MQVLVGGFGFLGVLATALFGYLGVQGGGDHPRASSTPSAPHTPATPPSTGHSPTQTAPTTEDSSSPADDASPQSYTMAYEDKPMAVSLAADRYGSLDFDVPAMQSFGRDEYDNLTQSDQDKWDLFYFFKQFSDDAFLTASTTDGPVAKIDEPPASPEECATEAHVGGFTSANLSKWPLKVGNGFCLFTNEGNLVRLRITKFTGGNRHEADSPPDRVEFKATMWRAGQD